MHKYLIFIVIGIILFLLYNNYDSFSVGIPFQLWAINKLYDSNDINTTNSPLPKE